MTTARPLAIALVAALAVWIGACSTTPEIQRYKIHVPAEALPSAGQAGQSVLAVDYLSTDAAYDEQRMVYRPTPYRLEYYHYHRWAAAPGLLVSDALRRAYAKTGYFREVVSGMSAGSDLMLTGRVVALEEVDVSETKWLARLILQLELRDATTGRLLWSQVFEEEEPMPAQTPEGLAQAASTIVSRIVARTAAPIAEAGQM